MMNMSRKWMMLLILILGGMIASGCASKARLMAFDEAKATFQKATAAGAKKCAPCDYATAEANLALADHGINKWWFESNAKIDRAIGIAKDKSLEALKATPCEKPAPPPEPPKPEPPPPPPPPEPPKPAPAPPPPPKPAPVFENVYFNENKTNIDPVGAKALDRDAMILKDNPGIKVEIGGHTDAVGSEAAKQKISEKRAESVKKYLMDKFNIPGDRMIIKGFGSQKPIADNKSKDGRAKNRRVEFRVIP